MQRAVEFLESKDIEIEARPTAKISAEVYQTLIDEFETDMNKKQRSQEVAVIKEEEKEAMRKDLETRQSDRKEAAEAKAKATEASEEPEVIKGKSQLTGLKEVGKIDLDAKPKAAAKKKEEEAPKTEEAPAEEKAAAKT
ncbi:MAG: translation initiation factor IF-2, partial [Flavobacteriia bacterium]|nr:translation initiation factor IF-2 [Flavobacteriia bacterium]